MYCTSYTFDSLCILHVSKTLGGITTAHTANGVQFPIEQVPTDKDGDTNKLAGYKTVIMQRRLHFMPQGTCEHQAYISSQFYVRCGKYDSSHMLIRVF